LTEFEFIKAYAYGTLKFNRLERNFENQTTIKYRKIEISKLCTEKVHTVKNKMYKNSLKQDFNKNLVEVFFLNLGIQTSTSN
jgi:hypothetical protein